MMRAVTWTVVAMCVAVCCAADLPPLPKAKCPDPATLEINAGRVIKFENPLPRMRCGNVKCGTYNNMELSLPGILTTSDARLGMFLQKMRETVMANRRLLFLDGKVIACNPNWIRDHVHIMKGWKHWEYDPLERSTEVSRRPVTLATWPFHPQGGWTLLGEERLTTWAEFRSGDCPQMTLLTGKNRYNYKQQSAKAEKGKAKL